MKTLFTFLSLCALLCVCPQTGRALEGSVIQAVVGEGLETDEEREAWTLMQTDQPIKAREIATRIAKKNPRSFLAQFVLGLAQHYAEGNFPKALFHIDKAERLYKRRYGDNPRPDAPWKWHARILRELAQVHGDLDHYEEKIRYIAIYNELYEPDMLAETSWPLMKLGRYREARLAAKQGLMSDEPMQTEIALNALCAIEFEAGHDGKSYEACKAAVQNARENSLRVDTVDLTNYAEAARSLFRLDEAERILLEATGGDVAWYGNPWRDLAELYTREGRFGEVLSSLKKSAMYRGSRPPHVRDSDRNESRRAIAAFFLTMGRPMDALRITEQALVLPDRRAHNSRDPAQDRAIVALIDRRARLMDAEIKREMAAGKNLWHRGLAWAESLWIRFQAWTSGRQATRFLADERHLIGTFRIGTAASAIMPPWLIGELVDVLGAGVVKESIKRARRLDHRQGAAAYYDAVDAEASLAEHDEENALRLASQALSALGAGEALLRARVHAVAAEAAQHLEDYRTAANHIEETFQMDPGLFRRLGLSIPVRAQEAHTDIDEAMLSGLTHSPRFDVGDTGLLVQFATTASQARICLLGVSGVIGCGETQIKSGDNPDRVAERALIAFHKEVFAPRVDLSQSEANSLDGTNLTGRDPLRTLFDQLGVESHSK